jgi:flagellar motor switch protein FliM
VNKSESNALLREPGTPVKTRATNQPLGHSGPFVFARSGGLTPEQLGVITQLHETFASLRATLEVTLVSAEQLVFSEFLQQTPERSYLASILVQPIQATALLELDMSAAWPIIDLLMGGDGKIQPPPRDLSEIEHLILRNAIELIIQELEGVWKNLLELKFAFDGRQPQQEVAGMLPPHESVLAVSLDVHILENRGTLTLCFPASVSNGLLHKPAHQSVSRKRPMPAGNVAARRRQVEGCQFTVEMKLPATSLDAQELLDLRPGRTLVLAHRLEDPVLITVADRELYTAYPVRVGSMRAGIIENRLLPTFQSAKEIL